MSLRLRGGVWYVRKSVGGVQREACLGYPVQQKAKAEQAAAKVITRWLDEHNGLVATTQVPTFAEWSERYRTVYSPNKANPAIDHAILARWVAFPLGAGTWGSTRLNQIRQSDCGAAIAWRRQMGTQNPRWKSQRAVSESTLQAERTFIQSVFQKAVEEALLDRNPWMGVTTERAGARVRLLTADAEAKLLEVLSPRFARFVSFLLETGLRLDEVRKIESRDIAETSIHVNGKGRNRRTVCPHCQRVGGKCRNVPLTTHARRLLADQIRAEGRLWTQHPARFREVLAAGCQKAAIDHLSPHDLRHTFGHRWLQRGGDLLTLSKVLGHTSAALTEKFYAHLTQPDVEAKMQSVMEPRTLRLVRSA